MKRLFLLFIVVLISCSAVAQNTIKFLGIPVDGTKKDMISKLEAKGYKYNSNYDYLEGEFNGEEVGISIRTVNNRVWRITVVNRHGVDEANIKVRFNNLFDQFLNNGKYELESGKKLTDSDDIWSGMEVYNLRYDASFSLVDKTINGRVWYTINKKYDKYRLGIFYENIDNAANGEDL